MPVSEGVRVMHGTVHEAAHGGKILLVCAVFIEKIPVLDCITLDIPPPAMLYTGGTNSGRHSAGACRNGSRDKRYAHADFYR